MSTGKAFEMFKQECPSTEIGHSKFYSLRPKLVKTKTPLQTRLYTYHEK